MDRLMDSFPSWQKFVVKFMVQIPIFSMITIQKCSEVQWNIFQKMGSSRKPVKATDVKSEPNREWSMSRFSLWTDSRFSSWSWSQTNLRHGHRWDVPWSDEPETFTKLDVEYPQFTYMCGYVYIYIYIISYYIISYHIISNTIPYHIILYYIVLYCIALYNILYCIILYDSVNIYITILYIGLILDFLNHLPSLSGMHIVPIDWFRRSIRQETIVFTPQIVARSCLPLHQLWGSWTDPYPYQKDHHGQHDVNEFRMNSQGKYKSQILECLPLILPPWDSSPDLPVTGLLLYCIA